MKFRYDTIIDSWPKWKFRSLLFILTKDSSGRKIPGILSLKEADTRRYTPPPQKKKKKKKKKLTKKTKAKKNQNKKQKQKKKKIRKKKKRRKKTGLLA